jgi:hypothetical protein
VRKRRKRRKRRKQRLDGSATTPHIQPNKPSPEDNKSSIKVREIYHHLINPSHPLLIALSCACPLVRQTARMFAL